MNIFLTSAVDDKLARRLVSPLSTFENIRNDTIKFGYAFALTGALLTENLLGKEWIVPTFLFIMGYIIYHLVIVKLLNPYKISHLLTGKENINFTIMIDTFTKNAFMLTMARLMLNQPFDEAFFLEITSTLTAYTIYDAFIINIFQYIVGEANVFIQPEFMAINDTIKFGLMFVIRQWALGKKYDPVFTIGSVGVLLGLVTYDLLVMKYIRDGLDT